MITNIRFRKKIEKHAVDFELDVTNAQNRCKTLDIIKEIINHPDDILYGQWKSQRDESAFYIKNQDVVVVNHGKFVTILKGGVNNERVKNARKREV